MTYLPSYPFKIAILLSGNGSNFQALLDAINDAHENKVEKGQGQELLKHCKISVVISNRKSAYGLTRAEKYGIPFHYMPWNKEIQSREEYDTQLANFIKENYQPDLVYLLGWLQILTESFINQFSPKSIINLHPALPDQYDGLNAIERAWDDYEKGKVKETGCMIHTVTPIIDQGDIITLRKFSIAPSESLASLTTHMHEEEHAAVVEALKIILLSKFEKER